ncbi:MAG: nicotinate phosphoribosyltransferase [Candidatus Micrarchaeia archaeon]
MGNALATDLYQLTMMQAFWKSGYNPYATFDYFVRSIPLGSYLVVAGLEYVIDYIKRLRFEKSDIEFLAKQGFDEEFLDYLKDFRFTGNVYAMQEGSIAFQKEPIIIVSAPIIEAQLVETYLLNKINFSTLIATKAARVVYASRNKPVVEFGMRRAHGEGCLEATRAAYIGGCQSTSNVMAGKKFGIPIAGTMAHSFVMSFDSEIDAFRTYAKVYPNKSTFLIDTYNTIDGAENTIKVAKELERHGGRLIVVRIDSGDLLSLSREVRKMLDDAGLNYVKIMASGDFNELVATLSHEYVHVLQKSGGTVLKGFLKKPFNDINQPYELEAEFLGTIIGFLVIRRYYSDMSISYINMVNNWASELEKSVANGKIANGGLDYFYGLEAAKKLIISYKGVDEIEEIVRKIYNADDPLELIYAIAIGKNLVTD